VRSLLLIIESVPSTFLSTSPLALLLIRKGRGGGETAGLHSLLSWHFCLIVGLGLFSSSIFRPVIRRDETLTSFIFLPLPFRKLILFPPSRLLIRTTRVVQLTLSICSLSPFDKLRATLKLIRYYLSSLHTACGYLYLTNALRIHFPERIV